MRTPSVLVVGSVNVDLVASVPALPGPGETVVGPAVQRHGGGKGANAAVAAARLGARVAMIGAVGDDDLGAGALAELRGEGIDVGRVAVLAGVPTGAALIVVDAAGENQIAVGAGANHGLAPETVVAAMTEPLAGCGCVVVSAELPDACVLAAVRAAVAAGVPCVLNPAPARDALGEAIALGPIVTPNAGEAALLPAPAGPVVETRGAEGVVIDGRTVIPAPAVDAVDTTGAGDTLTGALAARLAAGDDLEAAARYAVVAAALSVTAAGARGGMPTASAVAQAAPNVGLPPLEGVGPTFGPSTSLGPVAEHLVDRREAGLEARARRAQVQPPDAHALRAREPDALVVVLVQAPRPVAQRLGVVLAEALDRVGLEARVLEGVLHAREVQRRRVGEHVALGEGPGLGVAVAQAGDAVVQQPAAGLEELMQALGVRVDRGGADVLDHPDRGDRVERLGLQVAPVHDAELAAVGHALVDRALAGTRGLRLASVMPVTCTPWRLAACTDHAPQPHPTSSTRSPSRSASLVQTSSRLTSWASSSVVAPREKIAQL